MTLALFTISLVRLLGLTIFLKDPTGTSPTWYGAVHLVCTVLTCVCQLVLACVLWWRYRADPLWHGRARTVGVLAAWVQAMATQTMATLSRVHQLPR